jgi:DnaJ domain
MSYHEDGPPTHFEVLGVSSDATYEQIKVAFHRLARVHHPDKNKSSTMNDDDTTTSTTATQNPTEQTHFVRIQQAWQVLRDNDSRRRYIEALNQSALHVQLKKGAVIPLSWDDVEEAYDEETGETIFVYDCRCGEEVMIVMNQNPRMNHPRGRGGGGRVVGEGGSTIVECPGCCFVYEVPEKKVMTETDPS